MVPTTDEQEPLILSFSPDDDHDPLPHISDDGDDDDDDYDDYEDEGDPTSSLPALSSNVVFMLLLAPCLKLGAMSLATNPSPYGVAFVLVFGVLSFFSRQLLYLLSRYLRTGELGEHLVSFTLAHVPDRDQRTSSWTHSHEIYTGSAGAISSSSPLASALTVYGYCWFLFTSEVSFVLPPKRPSTNITLHKNPCASLDRWFPKHPSGTPVPR
jgi:hypothetical protein